MNSLFSWLSGSHEQWENVEVRNGHGAELSPYPLKPWALVISGSVKVTFKDSRCFCIAHTECNGVSIELYVQRESLPSPSISNTEMSQDVISVSWSAKFRVKVFKNVAPVSRNLLIALLDLVTGCLQTNLEMHILRDKCSKTMLPGRSRSQIPAHGLSSRSPSWSQQATVTGSTENTLPGHTMWLRSCNVHFPA